jgi:hypothetical protein
LQQQIDSLQRQLQAIGGGRKAMPIFH